MSADLLREATAEMRSTASLALNASPTRDDWYDPFPLAGTLSSAGVERAEAEVDAQFIWSWHPAVALAVADLLDEIAAELVDFGVGAGAEPLDSEIKAFALARAYLGRES